MTAPHVRVRFAPSPTGYLHIGGARTALFNYLFARQHHGTFVLRIEDTDAERSTEESFQVILRDLAWLGLQWDEGPDVGGPHGPYRQIQRLGLYQERLQQLLETHHAYHCFCSPELLEAKREKALAAGLPQRYDLTCRELPPLESLARAQGGEPHVIRLKLPATGSTVIEDLIRGRVVFDNNVLDDFVLARSSGLPTYNFAAVIDDIAMRMTHIIRGDDHLSNTPRQICLYQALGAELPVFAHVPMILGADKTRLSKRHGATAVGAYQEQGFLPPALMNYLALLGWSFDDKTTLFSPAELEAKFSLERVSKNPAVFDPTKLLWMNGVYIRGLAPEEYNQRAIAELVRAGSLSATLNPEDRAWAERLVLLVKEHLKTFAELPGMVSYFFGESVAVDENALPKLAQIQEKPELFKTLHAKLSMLESFTHSGLEALMRELIESAGIKFGVLATPMRAALTGRVNSPGLFEVMELLGKERTLKRLAEGWRAVGVQV